MIPQSEPGFYHRIQIGTIPKIGFDKPSAEFRFWKGLKCKSLLNFQSPISKVLFRSVDPHYILAGSGTKIHMLDPITHEQIRGFNFKEPVTDLTFRKDGKIFFSGHLSGAIFTTVLNSKLRISSLFKHKQY